MIKRIGISIGLMLLVVSTFACDITFKVSDSYQKESYKIGEEIVVELEVVLTHRNCDIDINDTKIGADGAKITGATKWAETKPGVYRRKLKVKILDDKTSSVELKCKRTCDKDGGYSELILHKKN